MKRYFVVLLALASLICFFGCESKAQVDEIVGSWTLTSQTIEGEQYEGDNMPVQMSINVNGDGTFSVEDKENDVASTYEGTWEKDDYFYTFDMKGVKQTMVISNGKLKCIVDTENNYIYEKE